MLDKILCKHSVVGVVGNRSTGKSMTTLSLLKKLKEDHPSVPIAVMGVEESLKPVLQKLGFIILHSKMDILDLQLRDTVIWIDELATFFDTKTKSKQIDKLSRFLDRIEHQNCKLLVGTAREGYFNKFMASRISAFIVKEIEYDALVNGTWVNERVKAVESSSVYRLELPKNTFYVVTNREGLTTKHTIEYEECFDSKKGNKNLFQKSEIKSENKGDIFYATKDENKSKQYVMKKGIVEVKNE